MSELPARIRVALRHAGVAQVVVVSPPVFRAVAVEIDLDARRVLVNNMARPPSRRGFVLLAMLVIHAGRV